jgi:hypothetical protein
LTERREEGEKREAGGKRAEGGEGARRGAKRERRLFAVTYFFPLRRSLLVLEIRKINC